VNIGSRPFWGSGQAIARGSLILSLLLQAPVELQSSPTRKVELATLEWEPYIGENLPQKGFVHEIVTEAFRSMGYDVNITFYPWARALAVATSGKVDGLFPEYYDESRTGNFVYSAPFQGGPVGFLVRKDSGIRFPSDPRKDMTATLQGMKSYHFGVVRGYINTKAFDAADFLMKDETVTDEQNVQKLIARRVDLIFIDQYVARHLIETRFPEARNDLEFLEPALEIKPLYIAFSLRTPDHDQQMRDFNEGMAKLQKSGVLKAILKRHGF
jgi:ABC-type amino acid transport substrate-binding protein